ncbi:MAG: septum formation protein Maf [Phycisphaerae bacterium]|nr:septum formation protein Maf [Phycisphaerae bacterium]
MTKTLVLASASPRRRQLLASAGFDARVAESDLDDARVVPGAVRPEELVQALSWFKARRVRDASGLADCVLLAADTVCVDGRRVLGKPRDAEHARSMIRDFRNRAHRTMTGVTLVTADGARRLFVDVATVSLGHLDDDAIDAYVASGAWRGKAGGYNYAECEAAGWPLACDGDPTSVMGLPMRRTVPLLAALGVARREVPAGGVA